MFQHVDNKTKLGCSNIGNLIHSSDRDGCLLPYGKIYSFVLVIVNQIHKVKISVKCLVFERNLCALYFYVLLSGPSRVSLYLKYLNMC